jgi:hypothetical protein
MYSQPSYRISNYREGDTLPVLFADYKKNSGIAINYAGMTVRLRIARSNNTLLEKTAVLLDPAQGRFIFNWEPGDHIRGRHRAAISFIDDTGRIYSTPDIIFDVVPPI